MRRICAFALAFVIAVPLVATSTAAASSHDTRVTRHFEHVGMVLQTSPSRWVVENLSYNHVAEVTRHGSHEFVFRAHNQGRVLGRVKGATNDRWDVFVTGRSERVGYVTRRSRRTWRAYTADSGWMVGDATGIAPIQGAAAVLISWVG